MEERGKARRRANLQEKEKKAASAVNGAFFLEAMQGSDVTLPPSNEGVATGGTFAENEYNFDEGAKGIAFAFAVQPIDPLDPFPTGNLGAADMLKIYPKMYGSAEEAARSGELLESENNEVF